MDTNTFLGVAYYPEAWDISQVETDLDKMRDYGIGCVRIAEFAWKTMEPAGTARLRRIICGRTASWR